MRIGAGVMLALGLAGCSGGPMTISDVIDESRVARVADLRCADVPGWVAAEAARPADPADLAGSEARKARALNAAIAAVRRCRVKG